jgi:uncharacterized membrane protein YoaK (UPF0700 family)
MTDSLTSAASRRDGVLLALAFAAGWIDAISYLGLGRVFTANMTGNTVLLGLALSQGAGAGVGRAAVALAGFAAGAIVVSRLVGRPRGNAMWPPRVTVALAVEAGALVALAVLWSKIGRLEVLVAISGVAMGMQSVAVRRLAVPGVATTYVTGTLTSLLDDLGSLALRAGWERRFGVWVALLAGAAAGAGAELRLAAWAAVGPAALVLAVCGIAAIGFRTGEKEQQR